MTTPTGPVDPERLLLNLLAQIHRDGGHHTGVHGVADSARDAGLEVARLQVQFDEARAELGHAIAREHRRMLTRAVAAEAREAAWKSRCPVTAEDVERAGVTLEQCEAWLEREGWALGSHPENIHRVWEKAGERENVHLSPNTPMWENCLASSIAVTVILRARDAGRPAHTILEAMAATKVGLK